MAIYFRRREFFLSAFFVCCSIEKPSWTDNLTARSKRKASSSNRSSGFPTARIIFLFKSPCPSYGSLINLEFCPPAGGANFEISLDFELKIRGLISIAIAFIVKSLRDKSSSIVFTNFTSSGWRLSEYVPSARKVVTSIILSVWSSESVFTPTVPKSFS